jgi:hypothetical protein
MTWLLQQSGREHFLPGHWLARDYSYTTNIPTIAEIAHGLAQINRFTGQAIRPYSVAEHTLLVRDIAAYYGASQTVQLLCLFHDAHECIVGDCATPVKQELGSAWERLENHEQNRLLAHYGLLGAWAQHKEEVKRYDLIALATERAALLPFNPAVHRPWPVIDTPGREVFPWKTGVALIKNYGDHVSWRTWRDWLQEEIAEEHSKFRASP